MIATAFLKYTSCDQKRQKQTTMSESQPLVANDVDQENFRRLKAYQPYVTTTTWMIRLYIGWDLLFVSCHSESFLVSLACVCCTGCTIAILLTAFLFFHIASVQIDKILRFWACTTAYTCNRRQHFNCIMVDYHLVLYNPTSLTLCFVRSYTSVFF